MKLMLVVGPFDSEDDAEAVRGEIEGMLEPGGSTETALVTDPELVSKLEELFS